MRGGGCEAETHRHSALDCPGHDPGGKPRAGAPASPPSPASRNASCYVASAYPLRDHAADPGQTLVVTWTLSTEPNRFSGQAQLQTATLK